jgi:hypothetical protein
MQSTNRRNEFREYFYRGDMPQLDVKLPDGTVVKADVADISAKGMGLVSPHFFEDIAGQTVEVTIGNKTTYKATGRVVTFGLSKFSGQILPRISVEIYTQKISSVYRSRRFKCSPELVPVAYSSHPYRFKHSVSYTICDFSADGMTLSGNSQKNIILPGTEMHLKIMIPMFGEHSVSGSITHIRPIENPLATTTSHQPPDTSHQPYFLGMVFHNPSIQLLHAISNYFLSDKDNGISTTDLKDSGFLIPEMEQILAITYVSNEAEWREVLDLRLLAAQKVGRWIGETDPYKLTDKYDKFARQLVCKIGDRIIAAGRIVFNDGNREQSEHNDITELPEYLWKSGFVELSRVCTHPFYRGSTVFHNMTQHLGRITFEAGFDYFLINCEDNLIPIYERIGAKPLGVRFFTPFMKETGLNLMLFDIKHNFLGRGNPLMWEFVFRDYYEFAKKRGMLKPSLFDRIRNSVYKVVCGPIVAVVKKQMQSKILKERKILLESIRQGKHNDNIRMLHKSAKGHFLKSGTKKV